MKFYSKWILFLPLLVLCLEIFPAGAAESSADFGYLVNFADREGVQTWEDLAAASDGPVHGMAGKVTWILNEEEGYTRFTPVAPVGENDESGDTRMTAELDFAVKENRAIAMVYRAKGRLSDNYIYLKDDTDNTEYSGKEHTWLHPALEADGQWHTLILDIRTSFGGISGRVKGIRIPITDTEDSYFDIQYIGAFKNRKAAETFDFISYLKTLPKEILPAASSAASTPEKAEADADSAFFIVLIGATAAVVMAVFAAICILRAKKV